MRQYYKFSILLISLLVLCSCKSKDEINEAVQQESKSKTLILTPFSDLNQGDTEINSHSNEWQKSILTMDYRSYVQVGAAVTGTDSPAYARIIKLADGSYILLDQTSADSNGNGSDVNWATSPDMKEWVGKGCLFKHYAVTNGLGNQDQRYYTNGFGKVLKNGDVLIFASYRNVKSYGTYSCRYDHGIEMIRSTDNGKTWSAPQEIHHGPNWEAMMLEQSSGELQCYFSESRPWISGSHSGTSMVKSDDGGKTWLPSVNNVDPYRVIRHTWYSKVQDKTLFTDQMPALIILNGSHQVAGAFESCYVYDDTGKHFKIAFAWSPEDGNWNYLRGDEGDGSNFNVSTAQVGPADRAIDLWAGAGPDLEQFPSGETLVSYTTTSPGLNMRIGDSEARNFKDPFNSIPNCSGSWGAMCMVGSHQVCAAMRNSKNSKNVTVTMVNWALNHRIVASKHQVVVDGDNKEWTKTDDALFVGSKCQAQATLRCSADATNVYFLIESLDDNLSKDDYVQLFVAPSDQKNLNSKTYRLKVGPNGVRNQGNYAGGWQENDFGAKVIASYDASLSDSSDQDNGWLTEIEIPRSSLNIVGGKLLVNFSLFDMEGGEDAIVTTGSTNPQDWITISGL